METNVKQAFEKIRNALSSRIMDDAIRIMIVATLIIGAVNFIRQDSYEACQGRYDQAYAIYARNTRDSNLETNRLRDELFKTFSEALKRRDQQTVNDIDKAFDDYFKASEEAKKQQANHPPPPLPEETCGKP